MFAGTIRTDGHEDRPERERCLPINHLFSATDTVNNYHQIFQTPQHVVFLSELLHGDSRGWWEEQTLVVETTNFNEKTRFRGATERVHIVERVTRLDAETLDYRLTVTDPATFTQPWSLENTFLKVSTPIFEDACHEGNYNMANILRAARVEEARQGR